MNNQGLAYYQLISELNLDGLAMIKKGDSSRAIRCFREGLQLLHAEMSEDVSVGNEAVDSDHGLSRKQERIFTTHSVEGVDIAGNNVFELFNRGLHIAPNRELLGYNFEHVSPLFSIALLFNAGLANHIMGLQNCNSHMLTRALQMYCVAYDALTDMSQIQDGNASQLSLVFLALANNMGHIHSYFCQFSAAAIFCNEFLARLSTMQESGLQAETNITEEEIVIFKANMCFFDKLDHLAAPAA